MEKNLRKLSQKKIREEQEGLMPEERIEEMKPFIDKEVKIVDKHKNNHFGTLSGFESGHYKRAILKQKKQEKHIKVFAIRRIKTI